MALLLQLLPCIPSHNCRCRYKDAAKCWHHLVGIAIQMESALRHLLGIPFMLTLKQWYGARFRQKFALEDAIVSHACSLDASRRVTNGTPPGCPFIVPVGTGNCVQTLKGGGGATMGPPLTMNSATALMTSRNAERTGVLFGAPLQTLTGV
jgi:hypothetical protein